MKMSNKVYDVLKDILYALPLIATFVLTIGAIWNLPYYEAIAGTITAIATLLAGLLKYASVKYNKEQALEEMHEADAELAETPLHDEG